MAKKRPKKPGKNCKWVCFDPAAAGGAGGGGGIGGGAGGGTQAADSKDALNEFEKHINNQNNPHKTKGHKVGEGCEEIIYQGRLGLTAGPHLRMAPLDDDDLEDGDIWLKGNELCIFSNGKGWCLTRSGWVANG